MTKQQVCAVSILAGLSALASAETDWSGKTGSVTIPAGETWVADQSDMAAVNALTGTPSFEPSAAELPAGWIYRTTEKNVVLAKPQGFTLILK